MPTFRAWKFVAAATGLTAIVVAADIKLNSHASERIVQHASVAGQPAAFTTSPIVGSDAATSTYGLDPARTSDW
ncbi:MAG TPA: hypothetical protein VEC94_05145 [Pseudolabrys sp.]|nr:hypothetical protein [Pseudolabrys sp.]